GRGTFLDPIFGLVQTNTATGNCLQTRKSSAQVLKILCTDGLRRENIDGFTSHRHCVRYLGWTEDTADIAFTSCLQHSFIEIRRNDEFTAGGQGGLRVLLIEHGTDANVGAVCKLRHESREEFQGARRG